MRSISILLGCAALAWAAEPRLIPWPREVHLEAGELALPAPVRISGPAAAERAMASLEEELALWKVRGERAAEGAIRFAAPRGADELRTAESYRLTIAEKAATVESRSAAGFYYGVQTLRQLLRPARGGLAAQRATVTDWPAFPLRAFSIDVSRGPVPTEEQLKTVIGVLGELKMNGLTLYMEHVFPYTHSPGVTPEGAAITPALVKRLAEHCSRHFVELIPQQQTFGHLHNMLKVERYSDLGEVPHGQVLAVEDERGYEWVERAARELASVFPGRFLYILGDETFELGTGRSRALVERAGTSGAWLQHTERTAERLRGLGRKVMIAGDVPLAHPEIIPKLPKELAVVSWNYDVRPRFDDLILPFRNAGLEVYVCPGVNNWRRLFPDYETARKNIAGFARDGQRLGAAGLIATHWNDGAGPLFNQNWYGVGLSAAASWQAGELDGGRFARTWDWVFHRLEGERVAGAIGKLAAIHERLRGVGLTDASEELFWFDPFSVAGAEKVRKIAPAAREIRLLAEEAAAEFDRPAPRRSAALRYLRFAARRADHVGYKVQVATYLPAFYAQAEAGKGDAGTVRRALNRGAGTDGRMIDLRQSLVELKREYAELWRLENRPYWLENVLLQYDHEALGWTARTRAWLEILERYRLDGSLPRFEELGWHTPRP